MPTCKLDSIFHLPTTQGEGALKEAQLQRRIALVQTVIEALVGQGARHLVVEQLRQQELRKLQVQMNVWQGAC